MLENTIPDSRKPIKFVHLQKLASQTTLNDAHVIEIAKTSSVAFMKARNFMFVRCRNKRVNLKKTKNGEYIFFKPLAINI